MTDKTQTPAAEQRTSKSAWKARKRHTITLHSGAVVDIELPDLPEMVKSGGIPNHLVDIAIQVAQGRKVTRDDVVQQAEFFNILAAKTVVEPVVEPADFEPGPESIPFEDKEMLVEFATRQRDMDAVGHHLGGLETSRAFRTFRGILSLDEDVAGL